MEALQYNFKLFAEKQTDLEMQTTIAFIMQEQMLEKEQEEQISEIERLCEFFPDISKDIIYTYLLDSNFSFDQAYEMISASQRGTSFEENDHAGQLNVEILDQEKDIIPSFKLKPRKPIGTSSSAIALEDYYSLKTEKVVPVRVIKEQKFKKKKKDETYGLIVEVKGPKTIRVFNYENGEIIVAQPSQAFRFQCAKLLSKGTVVAIETTEGKKKKITRRYDDEQWAMLLQQGELTTNDFSTKIPVELSRMVFSFLESKDLKSASLVCKHWNLVSTSIDKQNK